MKGEIDNWTIWNSRIRKNWYMWLKWNCNYFWLEVDWMEVGTREHSGQRMWLKWDNAHGIGCMLKPCLVTSGS